MLAVLLMLAFPSRNPANPVRKDAVTSLTSRSYVRTTQTEDQETTII